TPLASFRCFAKCSGGVSNARLRSCIILFKNFENNGSELIRTGGLVERLRKIRSRPAYILAKCVN
ncbi:hypothetical protein, partial [Methylocucumis oryzae]|uniref:hypothetical protein n=1 Tax=Methylocucumis oryzae TaxID=1632867 RepID=UPI0019552B1C